MAMHNRQRARRRPAYAFAISPGRFAGLFVAGEEGHPRPFGEGLNLLKTGVPRGDGREHVAAKQPPVGKRKGGEVKVDQNWHRLLDACSTQPGYYIALSERHAKRFIADAKAARTGEGKSPKNEPVK